MKSRHPYSDEQMRRLWAAWREGAPLSPACPFVVTRGRHYAEAPRRVLFIGQATCGFDALPDESPAEVIENQAREVLGDRSYTSAFWTFIDGVMKTDANTWARDHIAWSNLAKIGAAKGNPDGKLFDLQEPLCAELLETELRELVPHAVILATGNAYSRIIESVFAPAQQEHWHVLHANDLWERTHHVDGRPFQVLWTFHPAHKETARLQTVVDLIRRQLDKAHA